MVGLGLPAASAADGVSHGLFIGDGSTSYSSNWSGYAAHSGTYNSVSASWVEPQGTCKAKTTYASFWVGLDGYSSDSVEQTGSEVDCLGGQPHYSAWYEVYPAASVTLNVTVEPGDQISGSVTASGTTFTIKLTDATQGWTKTEVKSYAKAKKSSAEIIAEAPSDQFGILPLTDFGTVSFTTAEVNDSLIGSHSPTRIDIGPKTNPEDVTSALTENQNFQVTWKRS
jgi:hypothetical protein